MYTPKLFVSPYINFQGKAREAMEYYHKVLGGKLDMLAMDDAGQMHPAGPDEKLMHARLLSDGAIIMATDGSPDHPAIIGDTIAVSLIGSDQEKMALIFDQLAEAGKVKMPLSLSSWGDMFGLLEDRFGIDWMLDITSASNMALE